MVRNGICGEKAHGLKNNYSRFKLILCCLLPIINPYTKFHPNCNKLTIFAIGRFWFVGLVGKKMVVGISNSFCFVQMTAPIPNFIQIGTKTQVDNFRYWSVLFGWAGR